MKRVLILSLLLFVYTFATAQKVQSPPQQLDAAQLDKLAATPSLDQAILRIAAEKLRQEKKPTATVELQLTVTVSTHLGCTEICWYRGGHLISCRPLPCTGP